VESDAANIIVRCKPKAVANYKIRGGTLEEMLWVVDQVRLVNEREANLLPKFSIAIASRYLAATSASVIPAILAAQTITHAAIVGLVGDSLLIMRELGGLRRIEPRRPRVHEPRGRVIQVLDDFISGAALVAKLRHCVRNKQIGR
jgi:hypothetical protein